MVNSSPRLCIFAAIMELPIDWALFGGKAGTESAMQNIIITALTTNSKMHAFQNESKSLSLSGIRFIYATARHRIFLPPILRSRP